jgi:Family of unknown function (DUF5686)/CarboxypepD_reg-like domain
MNKTFPSRSLQFFFLLIALDILSLAPPVFAQTFQLSGTIRERDSSEMIPGASLHILGTTRGARTNADGHFHLVLDSGVKYSIRITALGYSPDTLHVQLFKDKSEDILLTTAPILGAPITISAEASRTEARRIMHKVIDTKDAWQSQINDYHFDVYSKTNLRTKKDTSSNVIAIVESSADGYWKRDHGYAERINARKQTADIPADVNRVALVGIQNFYNDRLDFADYNIISPVAHDAFDRYDYDLLGEGELNGEQVYKISVEPRGNLNPAFNGTLWIDQVDYTIAYLDLQPNDVIKIGPVQGIDIRQTFTFVDNKFLVPAELNFDCAIKLELPIVPEFDVSQSATLQNYVINGGIPDSIFSTQHIVAPSADSVDSIHWTALRTIPLERDEDTAYRRIDSVVNNFKSSPTPFTPLGLLWMLFPGTDFFQFNRVEGAQLELGHAWKAFDEHPLSIGGYAAYGFSDERWKYSAEITQALTTKKQTQMTANISLDGDVEMGGGKNDVAVTSSIGGRVYDEYIPRSDEYDPLVNTLTSLLLHSDYPDYYEARGFDIEYSLTPNRRFFLTLNFKNETDHSLSNVTNYSLLFRKDTFPANPAINDGLVHEISLQSNENFPLGFWEGSIREGITYSNAAIGSHFNYFTSNGQFLLEGKLGGWGKTWISAAWNDLLSGALPAQSLFFFDARDAVIAPRDVFRTLSPFEFQGDRTWTLQIEQNFYDLPTRALGIHMPGDLHWFGFANMAGASLSSATQALLPAPVQTLGSTPFTEAGFGIGNILNVLRFDAAWRLTYKTEHNFYVTGTLAISF